MGLGKKIGRFFLTSAFIVSVIVLAISAAYYQSDGNESLFYVYIVASVSLVLINAIRLLIGLNLVGKKPNTPYQKVTLFCLGASLVGIGFILKQEYVIGLVLVITSIVIASIFQNRAWIVFTEIRKSDHIIFRKRLIYASVIMGSILALSLYTILTDEMIDPVSRFGMGIYSGYIFSSILLGWLAIRNKATAVMDYLPQGPTEAEYQAEHQRALEASLMGRTPGAPLDLQSKSMTANLSMGLFAGVSLLTSIFVGLVLIPFYSYVLITNRVTVSE